MMKLWLCFALFAALLFSPTLRASDSNLFLKAGSTYYLWAGKDAPPPFDNLQNIGGSKAIVKIIQFGSNQWAWVEYDLVLAPTGKDLPVTVEKKRRWINFSQITAAELGEETNYAATYPQGYKIVAYDGLGP